MCDARMKAGVLISLLLVTATSCSDSTEEFEVRAQPLTRVCGADKYMGPQGVDVSTYQPNYDWAARKAAGERFGYARVTNGTTIIDDQFDRNWSEMKAQGIYRGVYQYFRPGQDATAQANLVIDKVGRLGPGDMPAMIDVETNDGQPAATVAAKVREWLDLVEAATGKTPVIYTGAYFWQDNVGDSSFGRYPLWIANYGADCPLVPDGWTTWTIWQYCDGNTQYCTNGLGFDRDVFNGTDAQLDEFAVGASWVAELVGISEPIIMEAGSTTSGFVELRNAGSATWDETTHLGTTEPRDRVSQFVDESWLGPTRAGTVTGTVPPGESYRFEFNLHAPAEPGEYIEHFGLVQEGVSWFGDQGGPTDDALAILIEVVPAAVAPDEKPDLQTPDTPAPDDDDVLDGPDQGKPAVLPNVVGPSPGVEGGCSSVGGAVRPEMLLLAALFGALRRRRR